MSERNLGTVFGPTLLGGGGMSELDAAAIGSGNDVVERLLQLWPYLL